MPIAVPGIHSGRRPSAAAKCYPASQRFPARHLAADRAQPDLQRELQHRQRARLRRRPWHLEIIAALLIAIWPLSPRAPPAGSAFAVLLFLGTLSFLFTTPGATVAPAGGSRCCRCCPASSCSRTWCWPASL